MDLDLGAHRDHADHGGLTTAAQHRETLFRSSFHAHRLEAVVHTATGDVLNRLHGVVLAGVHDMGCAHCLGKLKLGLDHVDSNDLVCPGDTSSLDCRQTNAASTHNTDRLARCDLGCAKDGTKPCGHTATNESGLVERHVLVDLYQCVLVHQHHLGERRQV